MNYPRFKNEPKTINADEALHFSICSASSKDEFLSTIKLLASQHCSDAISVNSDKSLIDVERLTDLSVDVKRLLNSGWASSGEQTIRFALASIYNSHAVIEILQENFLFELEKGGYIKVLKDIDCYAPSIPEKALFSSACTSLDEKNKELLTKLMLNYSGW
ncbi:hypothetical protein MTF66_14090 [Pseudoalteromonas sp. 2CM39R]|uniref:hypothetical protein n=1 Tax=Pseudoalteromonas sp. 2CM39R TaxID=2929856 RepID=UPI0020BE18EA|nr:hypothetical protein [Pseudoalteromonas sp. 2CM39R]MCK8126148.1 hypothetical protein [Pseudoalteromonas sp. 2CM39R]